MTKQELSRHNKIDDIWIAVRGKVYNVTAYIPFHPGGLDELMRAAGIDATTLFDQVFKHFYNFLIYILVDKKQNIFLFYWLQS